MSLSSSYIVRWSPKREDGEGKEGGEKREGKEKKREGQSPW